jgi:hypothetical protein
MSEVVPTIDPRELVHANASNDPTTASSCPEATDQ